MHLRVKVHSCIWGSKQKLEIIFASKVDVWKKLLNSPINSSCNIFLVILHKKLFIWGSKHLWGSKQTLEIIFASQVDVNASSTITAVHLWPLKFSSIFSCCSSWLFSLATTPPFLDLPSHRWPLGFNFMTFLLILFESDYKFQHVL